MPSTDDAILALEEGRHDDLARLIASDPAVAEATTEQGLPIVLYACYRQDWPARDLLLAASPTLDLHTAAAVDARERVESLLEEDPERLGEPGSDGFEPIHLASFFGAESVVEALLARNAECDREVASPAKLRPLHSACAGGHLGIVKRLLERGVTVDARQAGDFTPLMGAAAGGHAEIVAALLAAGADRSLTADGKTAADVARERGHAELASELG